MYKYDKELNVSYSFGSTLTIELLKNHPQEVKKIYFSPELLDNESNQLITKLCLDQNIEIIVSGKIFKNLKAKDNCFVIGEFSKYKSNITNDNHIVLVNPENDGNLGTIMRSALGFGFKNIIIIKPAIDYFNPKVIRSSMGAIFSLNITYYDSFEEYNKEFPNHHYYSFMLNGNSKLKDKQFIYPCSLVFGPESSGLKEKYLNLNDSIVISHDKSIDSLNLPIAVSIALYEVTKNIY